MAIRMQQRTGTQSQWSTSNPILNGAEIGYESDTNKFKIGDGTSHWNDLPYFLDEDSLGSSLDGYIPESLLGSPNGVAQLNSSGKLVSDQIPNVDEITQDAINTALVAGTGLDKTYDDNANTITLDIDSTVATKTYVDDAVAAVDLSSKQDVVSGVSSTEIGYLDGVTSAIQTQIDAKAPSANPTFTGTLVLPSTVNGPSISTSVNLLFPTQGGHITLGGSQTTGNLTLGGGANRTTGIIGIGTGATTTGTKTINIGTGSTGGATEITLGSSSGATSNVYLQGNTYANYINNSTNSITGTLFNNNTTGGVQIAGGLTTGNLNIAFSSSFAGTINVGTGAGTTNKTINIGTASTSGTTAITLGSSAGATSNITLNGNITLPSTTSIGNVSSTEIGYLDGVTSAIQTQLDAKQATLPSQSGNSGKYLTNDGSGTLSWGTVSGYSEPTLGSTSIPSGATVTTISGLTDVVLNGPGSIADELALIMMGAL